MIIVILKLLLVSLIPISVSIGMRAIDRYSSFRNLKYWTKQIILGVTFGIVSILGSELGVLTDDGAIINLRDAAPLCAGMIFGGPAGIIAGVIGGVERFLAVYWGAGTFTRYACAISTALSGVFAFFLRKLVFDGHHCRWYYGAVAGIFVEDFHMLMIFLTHMQNISSAYATVKACTIPMILINSFAVTIGMIGAAIVSREKLFDKTRPIKIADRIQIGLSITIISTFITVFAFTYAVFRNLANYSTKTLLQTNLTDVKTAVETETNEKLLEITRSITLNVQSAYDNHEDINQTINQEKERNNVLQINIVNPLNEIVYSTEPSNVGFDMTTGSQSNEFTGLNYGMSEYVQKFRVTSFDNVTEMKCAGVHMNRGGYVQVGCNFQQLNNIVNNHLKDTVTARHIGESGFFVVYDHAGNPISTPEESEAFQQVDTSKILSDDIQAFKSDEYNIKIYYFAEYIEGYYVLAALSTEEADKSIYVSLYATSFTEVLLFVILYVMIYTFIKLRVVKRVRNINNSLHLISAGDLNIKVNERESYEFNTLSDDINSTVDKLKEYIDESERRIDSELAFAKQIQHSSIPSTFPAFGGQMNFDIYASMDTAKQVGGDFYDFYYVNPTTLAIVIADVSGKGIPAAMFMMRTKTIIKGLLENKLEIDKAMNQVNAQLCEGNEAQMFVTAWVGLIDVETGHMEYVNAGHNPPLIRTGNGDFKYLKNKSGFLLAGFELTKYKKYELQLQPGDQIYLYTDGVTEAYNTNDELYGEDRLLSIVNDSKSLDAKGMCQAIRKDVETFSNGAVQSDDITMLSFIYFGDRNIKTLKVKALVENVETVTDFVDDILEQNDCPIRIIYQINTVIDEEFSNISFYAYPKDNIGDVWVSVEITKDRIMILTFEDQGVPFNPFAKEDPDIHASLEERDIGGLGVFISKQVMDDYGYENQNGRNIITFKKRF